MAPSDRDSSRRGRRATALDLRVPFFRPLWRRVLTVLVILVWVGVELIHGSPWWALLIGGIGVYCAYVFFLDFDLPAAEEDDR